MPKRAQQPAFVAQLQLQFQGKFTQAKKQGGVERDEERERGSRIAKVAQKKGKNTLRRQIKNVNIIVCVIVQGRQWACREWEGGARVAVGRTAPRGRGQGVKMFLNLAQKRLTTTFAIVSPWHKHTQPSSACSLSLSSLLPPALSSFQSLHVFISFSDFRQVAPVYLPFLAENMPQGMNTLSQLIASAGNNLETALLLLCESALPLFWTIPFYTHTHTDTHSISLCAPRCCCCCCAPRRLRKTF